MKNRAVVVFAPHPDDEILGCGGSIAKKLEEGYDVSVVFVTDGRNSLRELGVFSDPSPLELRDIRKHEAKRAAQIIGMRQENLIFLDIEDGGLSTSERIAQGKITSVLKESLPKEIYFPQEKEFHADHRATNRLVRNSIIQLSFHPIEYQYMIAWSYPFNLLVRIRSERVRDLIWSKLLKNDVIHTDISGFLSLKKAALEEYQSQLEILSRKQRRPALKRSFLQRLLKDEETFFVTK